MNTIDIVRAAIAGQPINVVDGMNDIVRARALDLVQHKYYPQGDESLDDEDQALKADDANLDGDAEDETNEEEAGEGEGNDEEV
jgi:hypothetical protein